METQTIDDKIKVLQTEISVETDVQKKQDLNRKLLKLQLRKKIITLNGTQ